MKTVTRTRSKRQKDTPTEHPHIVQNPPNNRSGSPHIRGTGIPVWLIARFHRAGNSVNDILHHYPHLRAAWVHDAISYYLDHSDEINKELAEQRAAPNNLEKMGFKLDKSGFYILRQEPKKHSPSHNGNKRKNERLKASAK
ncbi:MAG: DUF433 domain-containing protein [Chloroflexi bacterium]|nr:DUF433 domain-containing protein [Chloroflexota bacterium]